MSSRLVFVNNSRETFTPTHSGAIATCIRSVSERGSARWGATDDHHPSPLVRVADRSVGQHGGPAGDSATPQRVGRQRSTVLDVD